MLAPFTEARFQVIERHCHLGSSLEGDKIQPPPVVHQRFSLARRPAGVQAATLALMSWCAIPLGMIHEILCSVYEGGQRQGNRVLNAGVCSRSC